MTTLNIAYGSYTALTVTNLQSLAIDNTPSYNGWQSARVSNLSALADDYEIFLHLPTAATAAADDKLVYCYLIPWITTDGGSTWVSGGNFSTTTLPTGTEGTCVITEPNSMKLALAMPYQATSQIVQGAFNISQIFGAVPDGWSIAIRNNCGAALSTGCVAAYRAITYTNA
jgi:hypothetical protein